MELDALPRNRESIVALVSEASRLCQILDDNRPSCFDRDERQSLEASLT